MSAKHPYLVSTAAAARLLIMASTIVCNGLLGSLVSKLGEILQGLASVDSIDWDKLGTDAMQLRHTLERAISRSQRARASALKRRKTLTTLTSESQPQITEAATPEPEIAPEAVAAFEPNAATMPTEAPVPIPAPQPESAPAPEPAPTTDQNDVVEATPRYSQSTSPFPQYYINMLNGLPPF